MKNEQQRGEMVIYQGRHKDIQIEVTLQDETIWMSQAQIAKLFTIDRSVITKHLRNIFNSHELIEKSNVQKMHIASSDKPVKFYSLNAILSVGYRANSKRATQFRIWATGVLKEHILSGYTINEKRLKENQSIKLKELEKTISLLQGIIRSKSLKESEARRE
ncbi:MAG: RhuM family protein [bacterium]|nr:RhuM family protein [bacterium]